LSEYLPIEAIRFVKELYPRLKQDDAAIERYRAAIDRLPPIAIARDGLLVDGFHRWQAHLAEKSHKIEVENLGNLTDLEIRKESLRRNSSHGRQLETKDKRKQAGELYLLGVDEAELIELLSLKSESLTEYLRDAKREQKQQRQATAWDLWLNCETQEAIAAAVGVTDRTIRNWLDPENSQWIGKFPDGPPTSRQHFDIWQFGSDGGDNGHFGKMPPQVIENLLWLWTEPGQIIVDPFAGGGTTIDVAKQMGRRVWASDLHPSTRRVQQDIHTHDIVTGWPTDAPSRADLILLDPPYWKQAAGRYSDSPDDLGNMDLLEFLNCWRLVVQHCAEHLAEGGRIAYIVSPAEDDGEVVDLATEMLPIGVGLRVERRIIVPYSTQQASGAEVERFREQRRLLKLYRDLVVLSR
jgi:hypothetical protein